MPRYVAVKTSDVPAGGNKVVTIGGREIVIFHANGEFFALLNRCPHEGAPLSHAVCVAHVHSSEPGEFKRSRAGELLRCPWHGWEYDMRTGQSYCDPSRIKVRAYPVTVVRGDGLVEGPFVAETFPVTVEDSYVLVDV